MTTIEERLRRQVQVTDGCWLWTGKINRDGYGHTKVAGATRKAHRVSYETFVGPIAAGLEIDHLCRVRRCINPQHLEAVTHAENLRRGRVCRTGSTTPRPHLTASQRGEVKRRHATGESFASIARDLGVHYTTVSRTVRRDVHPRAA